MPSVCGIIRPSGPSQDSRLESMLRRTRHYQWLVARRHSVPARGVALGVVTLDTVPDGDALFTPDGQSALLLDGEIYNAAEEGDRLQTAGIRLETAGAAEVLYRGWLAEGPQFLARLHGLFTAILWDAARNEVTIVTDRFGMRPTYVARPEGALLVSSEVKALLVDPSVDRTGSETGFSQFFAFGYFFNEDTLFRGIRALPPACYATYQLADGHYEERSYAAAGNAEAATSRDTTALTERLDTALTAAVARRARTGEQLGLSLSGGLDARTLLALVPPSSTLTTVSIGIDGSIDHRGASELARLSGVTHHRHLLDEGFLGQFERHLREMILLTDGHYLDQGIVMPTLPLYRTLGIEKLLRGHAGELLHMTKAYAFSLDDTAIRASESSLEEWLLSHLTAYMLQGVPADIFTVDVRAGARESLSVAYGRTVARTEPVDRVWQLFLTERLHRETALSMHKFGCFAHVRMPYLDNDVVDALLAMPAALKLGDQLQTAILKRHRPEFLDVVNSNTGARMGAGALETMVAKLRLRVYGKLGVRGYQPYERLGLWLKRDLRSMVERTLLGEAFLSRGLFRPDVARRVVEQHMSGQANHTFLLMSLVIFELGQQMLEDPEGFVEATRA